LFCERGLNKRNQRCLRRRKNKDLANASHLVDDFMSNVKEPLALDFQRLRSFADARRKVYERCYKQLRDKVYAHKDRSDISAFVAKTNTLELGRLISAYFMECCGIGCVMAEHLGLVLYGTRRANR